MQCLWCKENKELTVSQRPNRTATSPNRASFNVDFCSLECAKKWQDNNYAAFADLDQNASDSECFVGEGWDGDYRVGHCSITGKAVRVLPMFPADRSGQPPECASHFKLRASYAKHL